MKEFNLYDECIETFKLATAWAGAFGDYDLKFILESFVMKLESQKENLNIEAFNKFYGVKE